MALKSDHRQSYIEGDVSMKVAKENESQNSKERS
jgi:hypothetical protein